MPGKLFLILLSFLFCSSSAYSEDFTWEKFKKEDPWFFLDFYTDTAKLKLEDKNLKLPDQVYKRINSMSSPTDFSWLKFNAENLPADNSSTAKVAKIFKDLPVEIKTLLSKRIFAWSVVKNLGSGGMTFSLYDKNNRGMQSFILIDESLLDKTYAESTNKKEDTVYRPGPYLIKNYFSKDLPAVLMLILHEGGHALQEENNLMTGHSHEIKSSSDLTWYPFTKISWEWDYKTSVIAMGESSIRTWGKSRRYYSKSEADKTENKLAVEHFNDWKKSNFASLYATMNPSEDWAETFAQVMAKKYYNVEPSIFLYKNGKKIDEQKSCLFTGHCEDKRKLMLFFAENSSLFLRY